MKFSNKKTIFLIISIIIISLLIWGALAFKFEKGAEASWSIGVGLFGALIGGLSTLMAFLLSSYQNEKFQSENSEIAINQYKIVILNDKINDYKLITNQLLEISHKLIEFKSVPIKTILSIENKYKDLDVAIELVRNLYSDIYCIECKELRKDFEKTLLKLFNRLISRMVISKEHDFTIEAIGKKFYSDIDYYDKKLNKLQGSIQEEIIKAYDEKYSLISKKS